MDPANFDLHIFDIDDTLVNTKEAYWFAQEAALREVYPEVGENKIQALLPRLKWLCATFGSGNVEEYFSAFLASTSDIFPLGSKRLNAILTTYHDTFGSQFTSFKHVEVYLRYLLDIQKKLAIVSNGSVDSQLSKLNTTGLLSFFIQDAIFISDQFPRHLQKPSPHMVKTACEQLGVLPDKAVFYGNSDVDVLAGNLAGTTTAHFAKTTKISSELSTYSSPDFTFTSWSEFLTS